MASGGSWLALHLTGAPHYSHEAVASVNVYAISVSISGEPKPWDFFLFLTRSLEKHGRCLLGNWEEKGPLPLLAWLLAPSVAASDPGRPTARPGPDRAHVSTQSHLILRSPHLASRSTLQGRSGVFRLCYFLSVTNAIRPFPAMYTESFPLSSPLQEWPIAQQEIHADQFGTGCIRKANYTNMS